MSLKTSEDFVELYIDESRLLKKADLQKLLNISRSTLYRWIKRGEFPPPAFIQAGKGNWHFKDYVRWLERRKNKEN